MHFRFTPEQEQFGESVRRFAEKHLARVRASARTRAIYIPGTSPELMAAQKVSSVSPSPRPTAARAVR